MSAQRPLSGLQHFADVGTPGRRADIVAQHGQVLVAGDVGDLALGEPGGLRTITATDWSLRRFVAPTLSRGERIRARAVQSVERAWSSNRRSVTGFSPR